MCHFPVDRPEAGPYVFYSSSCDSVGIGLLDGPVILQRKITIAGRQFVLRYC